MNTRHAGNIYESGRLPFQEETTGVRKDPENNPAQDLLKITDTASLSGLRPRLRGIMEAIEHPENDLIQTLGDNITKLQDAFVETVYTTMSDQRVDLSQKMTLRLNDQQRLTVAGEHPDKEKIEEIFAKRQEFSAAFTEIASQSELLRDMRNIGQVIGARAGMANYQHSAGQHQTGYQLSLKGEMSHFYFSK